MGKIAFLGGAIALALWAQPAAATDWLQFGFDAAHSGRNPAEKLLTRQNVQSLRPLYSTTLPGTAEGAPVYLANVATPGGTKDMLYLTLNNGTLLALDAASGAVLWSKFASDTQPCAIDNDGDKLCVTATSPALDPNRQFVYNYAVDGYAHKYRVGDGVEITGGGWPQLVSLKPDVEQVSSALSFATAHNGTTYLYVTTSGASWLPEDSGDYQGHVTAINLSTGTQVTFNMACSDQGSVHFVKNDPNPPVGALPDCLQQMMTTPPPNPVTSPTGDGGIWGRAGVVYDDANDEIYVTTGNGIFGFDSNNGGHNWSDSIVALPAALDAPRTLPLDSYTPTEFLRLMYYDTDLGSTSVVLAPAPPGSSKAHIGIQSGKDGALRIVDLDNMSGAAARGPGNTGGELFAGNVPQTNEVKTQPLIWTDPGSGISYAIVVNNFGIASIPLGIDAAHGNKPALMATQWMLTGSSSPSSTTAGGTSPVVANGVLYYAGGSGVRALNPVTGAVLWTDTSMGTANATTRSSFHKQSVIVVNNRVYVADNAGKLWAYQGDEIFPDGFE
jgi:hypothetical protein